MHTLFVVAIVAVLTFAIAFFRPVWFAGSAFVVLVFAKTLDQLSGGLLSYVDEVVILTGLVTLLMHRAVRRRGPRWFPGLGWFMAFGALGVISGLITEVPLGTLGGGAFLALKGVIFGLAVAQIDWSPSVIRTLTRAGAVVLAVILCSVVVNAFFPDAWSAVFSRRGTPALVAGFPSMIGPFTHPGDLGLTLALAATAVLAYRRAVARGWVSLVLLLGSVVGSLSSLRRKSIVGLAVAGSWVLARSGRIHRGVWVAAGVGVVAVAAAAFFGGVLDRTINDYVINWDTHPRVLFYLGGAAVAAFYFPFGAGFGRFGSHLAAVDYSPEYVRLGFDVIDNVSSSSTYLTDTQWPAIVGEAGWLGGIAFAIGLIRMWLPLSRAWRLRDVSRWERFAALAGMAWLIQILIESVAAPVFVTSPSAGVAFFLVAVVASLSAQRADGARGAMGDVDRLVAYQWDPTRPSLGGVDTCLRGLATYHDDSMKLAFVGVDATGTLEPGVWTRQEVRTSGRSVWFLPVARLDPDERRRVIPHGIRLAYGLLRYRSQLPRATIVQAHKLESAWALNLLFPKTPLVYFIHSQGGALAAKGSDSKWSGLGSVHSTLERNLVRRSSSVAVFNPDYAAELREVNPRVHAVSTWFDSAIVQDDLPHDPYLVVWVGRMEAPKDPLLALSAFAELVDRHPTAPWRMTVIGAGSLLGDVRAAVVPWPESTSERVAIKGRLGPEELAQVLGTAGVLLMTTKPGYEGYPRVLIEGLASGLPAVVTRGTDTGNLLNSANGRTCDRSPRELADAISICSTLDRGAVRASVAEMDGRMMVPSLLDRTRADAVSVP